MSLLEIRIKRTFAKIIPDLEKHGLKVTHSDETIIRDTHSMNILVTRNVMERATIRITIDAKSFSFVVEGFNNTKLENEIRDIIDDTLTRGKLFERK